MRGPAFGGHGSICVINNMRTLIITFCSYLVLCHDEEDGFKVEIYPAKVHAICGKPVLSLSGACRRTYQRMTATDTHFGTAVSALRRRCRRARLLIQEGY
jgi:hypothetical protein